VSSLFFSLVLSGRVNMPLYYPFPMNSRERLPVYLRPSEFDLHAISQTGKRFSAPLRLLYNGSHHVFLASNRQAASRTSSPPSILVRK